MEEKRGNLTREDITRVKEQAKQCAYFKPDEIISQIITIINQIIIICTRSFWDNALENVLSL